MFELMHARTLSKEETRKFAVSEGGYAGAKGFLAMSKRQLLFVPLLDRKRAHTRTHAHRKTQSLAHNNDVYNMYVHTRCATYEKLLLDAQNIGLSGGGPAHGRAP
jgi:hypothetical protein